MAVSYGQYATGSSGCIDELVYLTMPFAVHARVCLGRFHEFGRFLRPLRRLLFFRRQDRLLLLFPLLFEFFGHGVRSQYLWGVLFRLTHDYTALWDSLSSGIIV